jgi:hypothetical protein
VTEQELPDLLAEYLTLAAGSCFHAWRVRREPDRRRVAAQIVERFDDLNDNAERLFATPDEGLNR